MSPCSISPQDRPLIKRAISATAPNSQIYAAAGVKLYICPEGANAWNDCNVIGALVLHRQPDLNGASFLSVVALDATGGKVLWQHEIYHGMKLASHAQSAHFVYFQSDKFLFGFLFTTDTECAEFVQIYDRRIGSQTMQVERMPRSKESAALPPIVPTQRPSTTESAPVDQAVRRKSKGKRKLTRDDIGNPTNFRHLAHIGFDPERGFDLQNIPDEWRLLFEKAGVTREQLENKETAQFIVDFVEKKGGPPPIPPRSHANAPPPSTTTKGDERGSAPPPLPPRSQVRKCAGEDEGEGEGEEMNSNASAGEVENRADSAMPLQPESRVSLLESIRSSGVGVLKKAPTKVEHSHESSAECNDMASMLALALANRQQQLSTGNQSATDDDSD